MRVRVTATAILLLTTACASAPSTQPVLTWPPRQVQAPAEVIWLSQLETLRPTGSRRLIAAITGASQGNGGWRLQQPISLAVSAHHLVVIDTLLQSAVVCDHRGTRARILETPPDFAPIDVAFSPDGTRFLIADRATGSVYAFAVDGKPQGRILAPGVVRRCGGMTVCANGDLVLTDAEAGQIVRLTADGEELARVGELGSGPGQFNTPTAVAEAPDGTLWVLDTFNFRLQHLGPSLEVRGEFGEHGDGSGHFALPKGLAIDPDGHLYVSDAIFDIIQVFDQTGRLLLRVGGSGHDRGQLWNPAGLAATRDGVLAVADTGNDRVQVFRYQRRSPSS